MTNLLIEKREKSLELAVKLKASLHLQTMFDIDWSNGVAKRYVQTKYIGGVQQVYKSWIQQGESKIDLSATQYEQLSGKKLNFQQLEHWFNKG